MIKRFDLVRILSIDRVKFVSGPAGRPASPQGIWSVVAGAEETDLLIAKEETVVRIPIKDVAVIAAFDNNEFLKRVKTTNIDDIDRFLKEQANG